MKRSRNKFAFADMGEIKTLHNIIVDSYVEKGYSKSFGALNKEIRQLTGGEVGLYGKYGDAWRQFGNTFEIIEVEDTHPLTREKLAHYYMIADELVQYEIILKLKVVSQSRSVFQPL